MPSWPVARQGCDGGSSESAYPATPKQRHHQPIKITVRPLLHGPLAWLMIGITAFEIGNCASTLLILRASQLFMAGHGKTAATQPCSSTSATTSPPR